MAGPSARSRDEFAAGYGSDDEPAGRRRLPARGYGALPGDLPAAPRTSGEATAEYAVRQSSGGPPRSKVRYIESLWTVRRSSRLSRAQTRPRTPFERHCAMLSWCRQPARRAEEPKSDLQLLREHHRFIRQPEDEEGTWEARLAARYYERLFREYVICDLRGYRKGEIGLRWRTEAEVRSGKGQFFCGHKPCASKEGLRSYEVDFRYSEAGASRRALVKARLCEDCAYKLHYRRLRKAERRGRRPGAAARSPSPTAAQNVSDGDAGPRARSRSPGAAPPEDAGERRATLEALAWKGPDPQLRTREDDIDDFLADLFL